MLNVTGNRDVYIWVLAVSAPVNVRLRSAHRGNSNNTWYVNSGGYLNNNNANNANNRALRIVFTYFTLYGLRVTQICVNVRDKEPTPCRKANN